MKTGMELLAKSIVEYLGGISNVKKVENCITRLRISVHSLEKTELQKIEKLKGVLHIFLGNTVQIVVGPGESKKLSEIINRKYFTLEKKITDLEDGNLLKNETFEIEREKFELSHTEKRYKPVFFVAAILVLFGMIKKKFR